MAATSGNWAGSREVRYDRSAPVFVTMRRLDCFNRAMTRLMVRGVTSRVWASSFCESQTGPEAWRQRSSMI